MRAGQFIAAEIDRLAYIASFARNPQPVMAPEDGGEVVPGRGKVLKHLTGYRPEGDRTLNPDVPETAVIFEPGQGSDPATWFGYGTDSEGEPPIQVSHVHDGDTAYDGVCKNCDPTQTESADN